MTFSVIIPAYNREKELPRCIESVLKQTCRDFEIIIVDNGSTDNTKKVAQAYMIKSDMVRYFWQENTGSPAGSRNTGIKYAVGKWIAFLDSDDYWYNTKLEEVRQKIDILPDEYIAVSHYEDKEVDGKNIATLEHGKNLSNLPYKELLFGGNSLSTSAMVARRDKLLEVGLFDTRRDYFAVEDYDMWMKLSKIGKFAYIYKSLGVFSVSGNNMSGNIELINNNLKELVLNHIDTLAVNNKEKLKKIHGARIDYYKGRAYQLNGQMLKAIPILLKSIKAHPFCIKKYISIFFAIFGIRR
jgi:glycosyltransferase, family 2